MTLTDHPISAKQVKLLMRAGEGLTVEFKERYTPRIDEDIVVFANAKGGTLLLGVWDDGIVVGERLTNDLKAKINSLARNCKPTITTEFSQVGEVVAVVVPEGKEKPYSCGSGHYRRLDSNTQKMSHDELRIMFAENTGQQTTQKTAQKVMGLIRHKPEITRQDSAGSDQGECLYPQANSSETGQFSR